MSSVLRWLCIGGAFAFLCTCTDASKPTALSVVPSLNWYGDDGTWSAISLRVGTPQQWIDVMVSTVSSETWVVGTGACFANDSRCITSRGGHLFDPLKSSTWHNEGFFQFSADIQLGNKGYGWYGLDDLTFGSTGVTVSQSIIGSFNGSGPTAKTRYMLGLFGLGVDIAQFNNDNPLPVLNGLVERNGQIPSHSYGFTAGAHYQQKGEPLSLTLGGYDANRFIPHNVTFNLNPDLNAQAAINSIFVSSGVGSDNITVPKQLLQPSDRVSAIIDSSTPFLWLPGTVCDRFAQVLGLTYNDSLNLYTYDGNLSQHTVLANSQLSFTFSLSDLSSSPVSVNITLPFAAFDLQLTYPAIPNSTYGYPDATKNYFPLRRALDDSQYTIGRAFLQEAYLITDYERNTFSVHQAVHTANPLGNTSIISIEQPRGSKFSSPGGSGPKRKLSTGDLIGIAIGAFLFLSLIIFLFIFFRHRHRLRKHQSQDEKPISPQPKPKSFFCRMLNHRKETPPIKMHEVNGNTTYPTEVGADLSHERFELPAPFGPAELDSEAGTTLDGTTDIGSTQDSANLSPYEQARRKIVRSQIAASAAQAQISREIYPGEKNEADISNVAHYRVPDTPISEEIVSPLSPGLGNGWGTLGFSSQSHGSGSSQPSPITPGFHSSPVSPIGPPPTYRRFHVDPLNVVYAGRLPDNVHLPAGVPRVVGADGRTVVVGSVGEEGEGEGEGDGDGDGDGDDNSLGSEYTVEEELLFGRSMLPPSSHHSPTINTNDTPETNSTSPPNPDPSSSIPSTPPPATHPNSRQITLQSTQTSPHSPDSQTPVINTTDPESVLARRSTRRLAGDDFIHVPQPAENRFSWEEERI